MNRRSPWKSHLGRRAAARDYAAGDTIGGRFEVQELLGAGGFSKVYRVRDTVEGEERALKLFDNAAGYDAVRREIGALRKVHHPNVVKVIWADRTEHHEWYLIMVRLSPMSDDLSDYSDWDLRDLLRNPLGSAARRLPNRPFLEAMSIDEAKATQSDARRELTDRGYSDEEIAAMEAGDDSPIYLKTRSDESE